MISKLNNFKKFLYPSFAASPLFFFGTTATSPAFIHQFHTGCLAEFAYYIESKGEAVIIDPLRETDPYIEMAKTRNAKIKYIFETHFHADFVSGHLDLAKLTGAQIVYGPGATAKFDLHSAADGEEIKLGDISFKVLHTPGHTPESSCYLLQDQARKPHSVFTGDTLFLGEVGRPDLAVKSDLTKEDLASLLFDSLRKKLMVLPDETVVYPAHGAGSACGKKISDGTSCTMGRQKKNNYALQDMTKDEFINIVAGDLPAPPKYFFYDAAMNKAGYQSLDDVFEKNYRPLSMDAIKKEVDAGALIIDTRDQQDLLQNSMIPGSIAVSLNMNFAVWIGTLLDPKQRLVVLTDAGREKEAILRLARVGFENCAGYVEGGITEWKKSHGAVEKMVYIDTADYLKQNKSGQNIEIIDIRNPHEWKAGVYEGASKFMALDSLESKLSELDKNKQYDILCGSGARAKIAYTLMRRKGFKKLAVLEGGFNKLKEDGAKIIDWNEHA